MLVGPSVAAEVPSDAQPSKSAPDEEDPASPDVPSFGGPSSTGAQLEDDAEKRRVIIGIPWIDRTLDPYFDWKVRLHQKTGLAFGGDYAALYEVATESLGETQAAGGIARLFGAWTAWNREKDNSGELVFSVENRHRIGTDIAPAALGSEFGSALSTAVIYSNVGWKLTNLFWEQTLLDERLAILGGQIDATDYVDTYGLNNSRTAFTNAAFLSNPTIAIPDQGLGVAMGVLPYKNLYITAGFSDPGADATQPFNDPFAEGSFFTHAELGWTTGVDRYHVDGIHVSGWWINEGDPGGIPSSHGVAFSASWSLRDRWMPFLRAGYSEGDASLLEAIVSGGLGVQFRQGDMFGIGLSWGRPPRVGTARRRDQYTTELFYRFNLLPSIAVTPDVQIIVHPSDNPKDDIVAVFGIRARFAF